MVDSRGEAWAKREEAKIEKNRHNFSMKNLFKVIALNSCKHFATWESCNSDYLQLPG
jgi:hypothetical protein